MLKEGKTGKLKKKWLDVIENDMKRADDVSVEDAENRVK